MGLKSIPMLSQAELVLLLQKSLLSGLEPSSMGKLQNLLECFSAPTGDFIRKQNKFEPGLYILISGSVELRDPASGKTLSLLKTGDSFGYLSLLFPKLMGPDVYVVEDTQFIVLDSGMFRMLELSDPALAIMILRSIVAMLEPVMPAVTSALARAIQE